MEFEELKQWNTKLEIFLLVYVPSDDVGLHSTNNPLRFWKHLKDKFGSEYGAELDAGDL